ncbi:hypothetical protein [Maritalea myrionectae]|uniref:hypothetical protein n=1 Tax=Maritalea myrionectae TaxID=454601 RepID=UPI0003FE3AED|nr:hypothetical protein [Maritalea myrionectae]
MRKKQAGALIKPQNIPAKALGDKRFSPKIVEKKLRYTRKVKFRKGRYDADQSPFCFAYMDGPFIFCDVCA